ncbi:MAG: ATP-binding cassette domain-containing protein, partial [Actinomycetia bacterium]|nr:ATP-binding cassette domain-containing protein [Actinomycetes bacterium]
AAYSTHDLSQVVERFGLESTLSQHPYDLSGGQQQKLALAKLVLTKPQLLLLDEPTKGLDAQSKREIAALLRQLRDEGATMVLVTHDLEFVKHLADSATMLFDGQAVCSEPAREFFEHNMFYRPDSSADLS